MRVYVSLHRTGVCGYNKGRTGNHQTVTAVTTTTTPIAVIGLLKCPVAATAATDTLHKQRKLATTPNLNSNLLEAWLAFWAEKKIAEGQFRMEAEEKVNR